MRMLWFLGVNLLSREGNSQRGHRRYAFHPEPDRNWKRKKSLC